MVVGPEEAKGLPRAPGEAHVCGESERHMDVEDSLAEALVSVVRDPVEGQGDRADQQREGGDRERRARAIP